MVEAIITPRGINQARHSATRPSTRLITFPDGITRHITLPGWQWGVLDRCEDSFIKTEKIAAFAFEAAAADQRIPSMTFEEKLRYHFSTYLEVGVSLCSDLINPIANDW